MLPPLPNGWKARVSSKYGKVRNIGTSPHGGTDCVYTYPSPADKYPVYCPVAGTVTRAGGGNFNIVAIRDSNGYSHEFLHCRKVLVKVGQEITTITPMAYMSNKGAGGGVHVHYQLKTPNGKRTSPEDFWDGKPIAFLAAGDPNNKLVHDATNQGYNVTGENPAGTQEGTLYAYQGRQAGVARTQDINYAIWTNRVPQHEPWARSMMVDTKDLNKTTTEHTYNTSHNPQLDPDNEAGAKLLGRLDGDDEISRGPFWRR